MTITNSLPPVRKSAKKDHAVLKMSPSIHVIQRRKVGVTSLRDARLLVSTSLVQRVQRQTRQTFQGRAQRMSKQINQVSSRFVALNLP